MIPQLESARASSLSILEVAAQREKPGVITPSRKDVPSGGKPEKEKPALPQARRSAWLKMKGKDSQVHGEKVLADQEKADEHQQDVGLESALVESPVDETRSEKAPDTAGGSVPLPTVKISPPHQKAPASSEGTALAW